MVSGVSFKNPNNVEKSTNRGASTSRGILWSFFLLVLIGLLYGGVLYYRISQSDKEEKLNATLLSNQQKIDGMLAGVPAEFVARSRAVKQMIHRASTSDRLLLDLHALAVPGVVFQNFEHTSDEEGVSMSIVADSDTYETIAAQINEWKNSPLFSRVAVSDISRDEESGFILFTTNFVLAQSETSPFGAIPNLGAGTRFVPTNSDDVDLLNVAPILENN